MSPRPMTLFNPSQNRNQIWRRSMHPVFAWLESMMDFPLPIKKITFYHKMHNLPRPSFLHRSPLFLPTNPIRAGSLLQYVCNFSDTHSLCSQHTCPHLPAPPPLLPPPPPGPARPGPPCPPPPSASHPRLSSPPSFFPRPPSFFAQTPSLFAQTPSFFAQTLQPEHFNQNTVMS